MKISSDKAHPADKLAEEISCVQDKNFLARDDVVENLHKMIENPERLENAADWVIVMCNEKGTTYLWNQYDVERLG